ncbi:hypothetical protein ZTR_07392 [Talaromyces verruculosus]|nr:hypothetical protein ZTR_07392 [Talaromyces verruculosus]
MQFYALRIFVDRPFLSLSSNTALSEQDISHSQKSCFDAASSIARLAQIYRRQYTLRRANIHTVHLIFTAALIHVHHAYLSGDGEIQGSAASYLEICSQALSELGLAYKNARRALEVITYIKADLFRCRRAAELNDYAGGDNGRPNTSAGWQFLELTNTIASSIFNLDRFEQLYTPTAHLFEKEFDAFQAVDIDPAHQVPDGFAI